LVCPLSRQPQVGGIYAMLAYPVLERAAENNNRDTGASAEFGRTAAPTDRI
jgi:hypothetical protein